MTSTTPAQGAAAAAATAAAPITTTNGNGNGGTGAEHAGGAAARARAREPEAFARVLRVVGELAHTRRKVVERTKAETIAATVNLLAGKGKPRGGSGSKSAGAAKGKEKYDKDKKDRSGGGSGGGSGSHARRGGEGPAAPDELELPYWEMVQDFYRDICREDLELVLPRCAVAADEALLVPPCGRHYKAVWQDEDAAELLRQEAAKAELQAARKRKMMAASPGKGKGKGVEATSLPPLTTVISPIQEPESELCHVCCEGESTEENAILYCGGCNVAVHQVCYGVKEIPAGEWYCSACSVQYQEKRCMLCSVKGGALKPVAGPGIKSYYDAMQAANRRQKAIENATQALADAPAAQQPSTAAAPTAAPPGTPQAPPAGDAQAAEDGAAKVLPESKMQQIIADHPIPPLDPSLQWAHLFCSQWIPETFVSNLELMEPIENISGISKERWRLVCCLCKEKNGACIQCSFGHCATAFHPLCAKKHMLRMEVSSRSGNIDEVELRAYCPKHSKLMSKKAEEEASGKSAADAANANAAAPAETANESTPTGKVDGGSTTPRVGDSTANGSKIATPGSGGGESYPSKMDATSAENNVPQDLLGTCKEEEVKSLARQYICLNDLGIEAVAQKLGLRGSVLHAWMESGAGTPEKPASSNAELTEKVKRWLRLQGAAINSGSASKEGGPHLRTVSSVTAITDNISQLPAETAKNGGNAPNEKQAGAQEVVPSVPQLDGLNKLDATAQNPNTVRDLASPKKLTPGGAGDGGASGAKSKPRNAALEAAKLAFSSLEKNSFNADREFPHPHTTFLLAAPPTSLSTDIAPVKFPDITALDKTKANALISKSTSDVPARDATEGQLHKMPLDSEHPMKLPDVLSVAPDDEIVAEMLVLHKELICQLHANRERCAKLCERLVPEVEQQEEKTCEKIKDLIEVEQYMSAIREVKRLQRKEKKEKEHAAAVAAAEAAALTSSRRSNLPVEYGIPPKQPRAHHKVEPKAEEPKAKDGAKESLKVVQEKVKEAKNRVQTAEKVGKLMGKLKQMFDLLSHREQLKEDILKESRETHWQNIVEFMQQHSGKQSGSGKEKAPTDGPPPAQRKLAPAKRKLRDVEPQGKDNAKKPRKRTGPQANASS